MALQSPAVIGVDGCRGGWIAAIWQGDAISVRLFSKFADILHEPAKIIAVDMPMGLPQNHGRTAERQARDALLGRKSSVFAVPSKAAIEIVDYRAACEANLRHSNPPRRISRQSFHLFPKIREVDAALTPAIQNRVFEVHPELSYSVMNGGKALAHSKKTPGGEAERREMLRQQGLPEIPEEAFRHPRQHVARDDVFDACAAAWTARRILEDRALQFPAHEERDARGLLMRIHA